MLTQPRLCPEPNNESPLNSAAAAMWSNQAGLCGHYTTSQCGVATTDARVRHLRFCHVSTRRVPPSAAEQVHAGSAMNAEGSL